LTLRLLRSERGEQNAESGLLLPTPRIQIFFNPRGVWKIRSCSSSRKCRVRSDRHYPTRRASGRCTFTKSVRAKDKRGVDLISDVLPFGLYGYKVVKDRPPREWIQSLELRRCGTY